MTFSLSFPGCSHPGLVVAPSPGFDLSGLVAGSLLAPRSWKPPSQSTPFSRSVTFWRLCGAGYSPPLVSSLTAARFGFWPYGLAIAALPLVLRPWTGLCWSHLLSLSSVGSVRGSTAPVGWLRGVFPCFANCPTSSVLKRSSFGISASVFTSSLRDGVTLPGRVCLSPRSERSLFLYLLVFGWSLRDGVALSGRGCPRSRSERRLFAHLLMWLVSSLCDGVTRFGSGGAFLHPRSERRLLPFIYP